ncbi:hypothetical protein H4Q26_010422, partial [Puccinia striiformis f. sp. tritici PST-130]
MSCESWYKFNNVFGEDYPQRGQEIGYWQGRLEEFIQQEAIEILSKQGPPKGYYPSGSFQSSATHTPFLYNILMATLQNQHGPVTGGHEKEVIINNGIDPTEIPLDVDAVLYGKLLNGSEQLNKRFHQAVSTACSVMSFAANRRANALQLTNSVWFLACGMTER